MIEGECRNGFGDTLLRRKIAPCAPLRFSGLGGPPTPKNQTPPLPWLNLPLPSWKREQGKQKCWKPWNLDHPLTDIENLTQRTLRAQLVQTGETSGWMPAFSAFFGRGKSGSPEGHGERNHTHVTLSTFPTFLLLLLNGTTANVPFPFSSWGPRYFHLGTSTRCLAHFPQTLQSLKGF